MAREYAVRAEGDYRAALILFAARDGWTANNICYHCQQAAEKLLKAFIDEQEGAHGKTHDLVKLLNTCTEMDASFGDLADACERLNGLDVDARYPDNHMEYDFDDAQEMIREFEQIRDFVAARLACWTDILALGQHPEGDR